MSKYFVFFILAASMSTVTLAQNAKERIQGKELSSDEEFKFALPDNEDEIPNEAPARGGCTIEIENESVYSMYIYFNGSYHGRIAPRSTARFTPRNSKGTLYARSATGRWSYEGRYDACERGIVLER